MRTLLALGLPLGLLCLLAFLGLLAGTIVLAVVLVSRRGPRPRGFPIAVLPTGNPGRFRVRGVERATKNDKVWEGDADSEANAQVKAELEGIVVTSVERVH